MGQQIVPKSQGIAGLRKLLKDSEAQIRIALPRHMTAERMIRLTMTAVQQCPKLLECDQLSVIGGVVQASQLGLEIGVMGQAYLVPFKGKATLIAGYRGLIDLARRSGNISVIYAECVYSKDEFTYELGLDPILKHKPCMDEDRGEIIGFYAVAKLRDGGEQFVFMSKHEIDKIKVRSPGWQYQTPWKDEDYYPEMGKKTVARRLCKWLPMSVEMQTAVSLDEMGDAGKDQGLSAVIDIPASDAKTTSLDDLADKMQGDSEEQPAETEAQETLV